jgi:hypothetical protein
MSEGARSTAVVAACGVLLAAAAALIRTGLYGLTLFAAVPVLAGAIAAVAWRSRTYRDAAFHGAMTVCGLAWALILVRVEGVYCVVMVTPLLAVLGAVGGMIGMALTSVRAGAAGGATMMAVLPLATLSFDLTARAPVFAVTTTVEIDAAPEAVWPHVVAFSDLPEPAEWLFRSGIAYPKRARIEGSGRGAVRYCEFSTGPFVEPIEVWDESRLLKFRVTENPAPLTELSPWPDVVPRHLHGYFVSKQGQFRLVPLAGGRTLLEGTTWYQHGLWPAAYWRWWSDAIIHRIHLRVLRHIRALAESR